jgi:hypothetical protein
VDKSGTQPSHIHENHNSRSEAQAPGSLDHREDDSAREAAIGSQWLVGARRSIAVGLSTCDKEIKQMEKKND